MSTSTDSSPFLAGDGEMRKLIRHFDWSSTSLGIPDQWPQSLRTMVSVILHSKFPMFLWWGEKLIQFYNDAYRPSLGNEGKHPTALGQPGKDCWPEIWPTIKPLIDQVLAGGEATWSEDQLIPIYRNGQLEDVYWTFSYSPVPDEFGQPTGVLVTCSETTKAVESMAQLQQTNDQLQQALQQNQYLRQEEQAAQQQLQASLQNLLVLFEQSPVAIALISQHELTFQVANPFYGHLVGRLPEEIIGKPLLEALPELVGQGFDDLLNEVIATGTPFIAKEVRVEIVRNGQVETIYVDLIYQPRREANGTISGILVVATDVTAQVLTRQQIEESEARFRALIEEAPIATCLFVGRELRIEVANEAMIEFWGKGSSVRGKSLMQAIPELVDQPFLAILDQVFTTGQSYAASSMRADLVVNGILGAYYFDFTYKPLRDAVGDVYAIMSMATDVTQQVLARRALEESEAALRNAIELAELGTWTVTIETGVTHFSSRHAEMFGLETTLVSYEEALALVHPDDRGLVGAAFEAAMQLGSDGRYQAEYRIHNAHTGKQQNIRARGETSFDEEGHPIRIVGTTQDFTLERELQLVLEAQVQQRTDELQLANQDLQRSNDDLQQFAYIASHDLQEPLRKIQSFSALLEQQFEGQLSETGKDYLQRITGASARMSILIKDLLNYSRISTRQQIYGQVSLEAILAQALSTLDWVIAERGVLLETDELPVISGDASQLSQLFQNLLSNAIKFTPIGQTPRIQIQCVQRERRELPMQIKPTSEALRFIQISVRDRGVGFDVKYIDRIFQVFQRLHGKNEFPGTGIGLAICQRVAENHGGGITATSLPGEGATFCVYLPS